MSPEQLEEFVTEMTPHILGPNASDPAYGLRFLAREIERRTRDKAESLIRELASNLSEKMGH